jgi:hypothetical protein
MSQTRLNSVTMLLFISINNLELLYCVSGPIDYFHLLIDITEIIRTYQPIWTDLAFLFFK